MCMPPGVELPYVAFLVLVCRRFLLPIAWQVAWPLLLRILAFLIQDKTVGAIWGLQRHVDCHSVKWFLDCLGGKWCKVAILRS